VGDITVRVWYSGRYYCQSEAVGDITVRAWYNGRYYCQSELE